MMWAISQPWLTIFPLLCGIVYGFISVFRFSSEAGNIIQADIKKCFWVYPIIAVLVGGYFALSADWPDIPLDCDWFIITLVVFSYWVGTVLGKKVCRHLHLAKNNPPQDRGGGFYN